MFCKNCGMKLGEEALFCPNCGTKTGVQVQRAISAGGSSNVQAHKIAAHKTKNVPEFLEKLHKVLQDPEKKKALIPIGVGAATILVVLIALIVGVAGMSKKDKIGSAIKGSPEENGLVNEAGEEAVLYEMVKYSRSEDGLTEEARLYRYVDEYTREALGIKDDDLHCDELMITTYDAEGNILSEESSYVRIDTEEEVVDPYLKCEYTYDGDVTKRKEFYWSDGEWSLLDEYQISYVKDGVELRIRIEPDSDFECDGEGHIIRMGGYDSSYTVYEYDGNGCMIRETKYKPYYYEGISGFSPEFAKEYEYDSRGNLTAVTCYRKSVYGGANLFGEKTEDWDDSSYLEWLEGGLTSYKRESYTYDENNRLTSYDDGAAKEPRNYIYDETGNLIRESYDQTVVLYSYGKDGSLTQKDSYKWD